MLTINKIQTVVSRVGKQYGIERAYLFGSYARDEATNDSDVDLVIHKGKLQTYNDFFHLHEDLERELGTSVDLLTEVSVRPKFLEIIKDDMILIYDAKQKEKG